MHAAAAHIVDGTPLASMLVQHRACPSLQVAPRTTPRSQRSDVVASEHEHEHEEASQHAILVHGLEKYGSQLQDWTTRDELEKKLDAVVEDVGFLQYVAYLQQLSSPQLDGEGPEAFVAAYRRFVGRDTPKVREFCWLAFEGCRALSRLRQSTEHVRLPTGPTSLPERLGDISTPVDYTEAILAGLRACACDLALVQAFDPNTTRTTLVEGKVDILLDVAIENQRAWLRLVAGLPAAEVPKHIVPLDERIDWDNLVDSWNMLHDQVARFERAARESPDGVCYPLRDARIPD